MRWLKAAYTQDLFPKILEFPAEYKDVDERLTNTEVGAQFIASGETAKQELTTRSTDWFTFVLRKLNEHYDLKNPVERKKVLNLAFDIMKHIEDWSILSLYLDTMSRPFGTWADILLNQFKSYLKKQRTSNFQKVEESVAQEESSIQPKYLMASLWYDRSLVDGAIDSWLVGSEKLKHMHVLIGELSTHFPESLISHIWAWSLAAHDQQKLLEAQLRWEHQFWTLANDKKINILLTFLQQQMHTLERVILKSKNISDEQKQEIMGKVRELKR